MISALILDWSGTLCDDAGLTLELTNKTLAHFGFEPVTREVYDAEFTLPVSVFYEKFAPGVAMADIDAVFFESFKNAEVDAVLFEGAKTLLEYAATEQMPVYLCSTLATDILSGLLKQAGLLDCVDEIWGGASNKCEVLAQQMHKVGVPKDQILFVGDTPHDLEAAAHVRIRKGASLYGYTEPQRMKDCRPDHAFSSCLELLAFVREQRAAGRRKQVIATVGGLIENERGEVLLIQTEKWNNLWGTPGGKMEYGETMAAAFAREVREETGLEVTDIRFVCIQDCVEHPEFYAPRHFLLINYHCKTIGDQVTLNYESKDHRWVSPEAAVKMELNTPTRVLIEKVFSHVAS